MDASRELLERSLARKSQELELAQRQLLQYLQDEAVIEEEHVTDLETVCKALHAPGSYRPAVAELEDEVIHLHASLRECNQQLERQALELEQLRPPLASSRLAGSTYQPGLGAKAAELSRGGAPAECGSAEEEAVVLRHALNQALREQDSLKGHLRALMALYGHQDQDLAETCRPRDAERRFGASVGTSAMSDLEQLCAKRDLAALGSSQISGLGSPESGAGSVLVLESSPLDAEAASMIVLESSPLEAGAASLVILQGEASVSSEPNSLNFSPKETIAREFFECETCGQIFRQLAAAEAHEAACQPSADAAEPAADLAPNLEESEAPEPLSEAALRVFERVCRRIVARLQCTAVRSWILWSRSERQMKAVLQASLTRMTHQRLTRCWTSWQLTATEAKYRQSVAHGVMCHIEERNMSSAWHHWRQADATAGQQANLLRKGAAGFSHTKPGLLQAWNSWRSWYCDQRVGRAAAGRMVQQLQWRAYNLWQSVCQAHKAERTALHAAMSWLVRRSLLKAWSSLIVAVQDAKAAMAKLRHAVMRILMLRQASCFQSWQKWSGWRKAVQQGCWAVINKLTHKRLVAAWNLWCSWARHRAYLHTERQLAEASAREAKLTAEREEQRVALMEAAAELKELVVADSQMPDQLDDSYEQLEPDGGTTELESGQNNGASGLNPQVPALLQGRIPLSERMGESAPDVSKEHAKLKAKQQLTEAEAMAVQLEVVSQESRDAVKTGLVCTQLEGAVSEETRDAVKTGLVRTQLEGAVSEETREEIKAELEAQILEAPIESHSHTPDNMASKEETEQATKSPAEQQVDMDPQQSEGDKQVFGVHLDEAARRYSTGLTCGLTWKADRILRLV